MPHIGHQSAGAPLAAQAAGTESRWNIATIISLTITPASDLRGMMRTGYYSQFVLGLLHEMRIAKGDDSLQNLCQILWILAHNLL